MAKIHRLLPLLLLSVGCNKLFAKDTPAPKDETEESDGPKAKAKGAKAKTDHGDEDDEKEAAGSGRFAVPFAWEASPQEPLAKARNFMAEVLKANETFVGQGSGHFKPFLDAETPRATVLTCADSRVQSDAWDDNPENDAYTVRNLGNQLSTSLGSVQYGVDSLNTPVLLIIGHTGCDAVKAALDKDKGKGPIADEIAHIELPGLKRSKDFDTTWNNAVLSNVNAQVDQAVSQFSNHVQSGDLTVVGAVYDFRNDLENGSGRLSIVNVNGNVEKARIEAFEEAVQEVNKKAAAQASLSRRTLPGPSQPFDRTAAQTPGARASVNALNMLASGSFPTLRPGMPVPGTVDLKVASTYRPNVPRAAASEDRHGDEHGEKKTPAARHAAPTGGHGAAPDRHADTHDPGDEHDEDTAHAPPAKPPRPEAARAAARAAPTDPRFQPPPARPGAAATGHAGSPANGHAGAPTPGAPAAPEQTPAAAGQYRAAPYNPLAPPPAQRAVTPLPRPGAGAQGVAPVQAARAPAAAPAPATLYPTLGAPPARAPAAGQPNAPAGAPAQRAATPAPAPAAPVQRGTAPVRGAAAQAPRGAAPGQVAAPAKPPAAGQARTPAPPPANPPARAGAAAAARPGAAPAAPAKPTAPAASPGRPAAPPAKTAAPAPAQPPAAPAKPAPPRLPLPGPVTSGPAWPEDEGPPNQRRAPAAKPGAAPAPPANPTPPADRSKTPAKAPARKVPPRKGT